MPMRQAATLLFSASPLRFTPIRRISGVDTMCWTRSRHHIPEVRILAIIRRASIEGNYLITELQ